MSKRFIYPSNRTKAKIGGVGLRTWITRGWKNASGGLSGAAVSKFWPWLKCVSMVTNWIKMQTQYIQKNGLSHYFLFWKVAPLFGYLGYLFPYCQPVCHVLSNVRDGWIDKLSEYRVTCEVRFLNKCFRPVDRHAHCTNGYHLEDHRGIPWWQRGMQTRQVHAGIVYLYLWRHERVGGCDKGKGRVYSQAPIIVLLTSQLPPRCFLTHTLSHLTPWGKLIILRLHQVPITAGWSEAFWCENFAHFPLSKWTQVD